MKFASRIGQVLLGNLAMSKESFKNSASLPPRAVSTLPSLAETDTSSVDENRVLPTFDLYPTCHLDGLLLRQEHRVVKVHVIRHAEGTHNVDKLYNDISNLDARLTAKGKEQCSCLAKSLRSSLVKNPQLIVTSPMTRCVQTALLSFPTLSADSNLPIVALESVRETVNYNCDRRRPISDIAAEYPRVDFSLVRDDNDGIWDSYDQRLGSSHSSHRESGELHVVADRARDFFSWLQNREDNVDEVILYSHSAFLRCIFGWGQDKGGVLSAPPQVLENRKEPRQDIPVFRYCGGDDNFETSMRADYANCEMRSFLVAFPKQES